MLTLFDMFDGEDVVSDFDPDAWHPAWCEPLPCEVDDLVWDVDSSSEECV